MYDEKIHWSGIPSKPGPWCGLTGLAERDLQHQEGLCEGVPVTSAIPSQRASSPYLPRVEQPLADCGWKQMQLVTELHEHACKLCSRVRELMSPTLPTR